MVIIKNVILSNNISSINIGNGTGLCRSNNAIKQILFNILYNIVIYILFNINEL